MNRYRLRPDDAATRSGRFGRRWIEVRQYCAIERNADERDYLGAVPANLSGQDLPACGVFVGTQDIDAGARPRDQIGEAKAPLWQPLVVLKADGFGHYPRIP